MFIMRPGPSHSFSPAHASAHPPSTSPTPLWEVADMLDWQVLTVQLGGRHPPKSWDGVGHQGKPYGALEPSDSST